jgi:hypothetical protein
MKTFGFPQIMRDGGGGDGGGGDGGSDGDWEDAFAEANDHTDFSSQSYGLTSDNFADPEQLGAEAYENQDFGFGLDMDPDFGLGRSQSFADRGNYGFSAFEPNDWAQGPNQGTAQDYDPFGFGAQGTFGQRGQGFADAWGAQGLGYNTNPSGPVGLNDWQGPNQVAQAHDPFGFGARGTFGLEPGMSYSPAYAPSYSPPTSQSVWANPGVNGLMFDPNAVQQQQWAPGPPIASITVNPSQSNPGHYEQAPPGATPTAGPSTGLSYGLPAATHPGARAGELDFGAIAGSGIDSLFSNTRGNVSPEALAYDQARHIPQQISPTDWFSEARGNVSPELLEMEAAQSRPYQMPWGWMSNTRGNLSEDDPEVQAVMARMRG